MDVESKLREELVPILGQDSVEDVKPESALVGDLGAESIDFVEIMYMVENSFGVKIRLSELTSGENAMAPDAALSAEQAARLNAEVDGSFTEGMTTAEIFQRFTVHNLACLIEKKRAEKS